MSIKKTYKGVTETINSDHIKLTTSGKYLEDDVEIETEGGNANIQLAAAEGWNSDLLDLTRTFEKYGNYGFDYDTQYNYLKNQNNGVHNSYAMCKIPFTITTSCDIEITYFQSSEKNYDYGFISQLDTMLTQNNGATDSNCVDLGGIGGAQYGAKGKDGTFTYTFTNVSVGEHYITIKYRKDSSQSTSRDTFAISQIKASIPQSIRVKEWVTGEEAGEDIDIVRWSDKSIDTPTETISITENGSYDVTNKASAIVNVSGGGGGEGFPCHFTITEQTGGGNYLIIDDVATPMGDGISNGGSFKFGCKVSKIKAEINDYASDTTLQYKPTGTGVWSVMPSDQDITITQETDFLFRFGSCLLKGTLITMADGTYKPIEDIRVGDMVKGYYGDVKVISTDALEKPKYHNVLDIWIFSKGITIYSVHQHRFYNYDICKFAYLRKIKGEDDPTPEIRQWEIGDRGLTQNAQIVKLLKHKIIKSLRKKFQHFTLTTEDGTYYANKLLSGNRFSIDIKQNE